MCGICGIINFDHKPVQEERLVQMMNRMKHRGPDDDGVFVENGIGFGFVRLSIIDLSKTGHQPMFRDGKEELISSDLDNTNIKSQNADRYVTVLNGEIFNYIEIREELKKKGYTFKTKSDTEVLLASYIEWGEECLDKFNGMWAFAIYDRLEKNIFLARDRYGIKPLYYHINDNQIIFASEIPPILEVINDKCKPNPRAIFDYLVYNRSDQTEETFFEGILKLNHGQAIKVNLNSAEPDNRTKIFQWYDLNKAVKQATAFQNADEFRELFENAIELRLRSDVPVGVCLSGGIDSSSIVSVLLKNFDKKDLNTFSAVYEKGQFGDETEYIDLFRNELKNMFTVVPDAETLSKDLSCFIKTHAEPLPTTSAYAQYKVMELAKEHVVVTLDGQGADEMLAGYHYFFGFYFKDLLMKFRFRKLIHEMYCYYKNHHNIFGFKTFFYFLLPAAIRKLASVAEIGYLKKDFIQQNNKNNTISQNLYGANTLKDALFDHFEYKLEHLLKWSDRNSMRFSVEARVPFLDHRLVERTLACDSSELIKDGITKHIFRESMKGIVPEPIRLRKDKIGFHTPEDDWLKTREWKTIVTDILNSESFSMRGIIDVPKAKHLFEQYLAGKKNIAGQIWKWVNIELWFREYID